ncbi:MAG: hypothetical protein WA906_05150, partial [Pacificimonas sp.]
MARFLLVILPGVFGILLLFASTLISSAPIVLDRPVPSAADVAAARLLAIKTFWAARQAGAAPVEMRANELEAATRLLSDGIAPLELKGRMSTTGLAGSASYRVSPHSWANVSGSVVAPTTDGRPLLTLQIGSVVFPPMIVELIADIGIWLLLDSEDGASLRLSSIIRSAEFSPAAAVAVIDVPTRLSRQIRKAAFDDSTATRFMARRTYLLTAPTLGGVARSVDVSTLVQMAFADQPLDRDQVRGALVGLAMSTVDIGVARLVDSDGVWRGRSKPEPQLATLGGRRDLAMHFILSAALATRDAGLGQALGEWKELADSLPGGSGFSFVDLAADRAGTRLAMVLLDEDGTERAQDVLATARAED